MSLFGTAPIECPFCDTLNETEAVASINADRRPDLREAILDRSFQAVTCSACEAALRLAPQFSYLDVGRGQWLLARSAEAMTQWRDHEAMAQQVYDRGYGPHAPRPAQQIGHRLSARVAFGWPAVREKLLARDFDLDDITLECLKMAVLRSVPGSSFSDQTELRLDSADADSLALCWFDVASETERSMIRIPRDLYHDIDADPDAWQSLRNDLAAGLFVDLNRFLVA